MTDSSEAPRASAALLLATARLIAARHPLYSKQEVEERARWLVGKGNAVGLDSTGSLYIVSGGIEFAKQAGLLADDTMAPMKGETGPAFQTPRQKRTERLKEAERTLRGRMDAARRVAPKAAAASVNGELAAAMEADPLLRGSSTVARSLRARERERAWKVAMGAAVKNDDEAGQ
jgi:hypothetical protein